MNAYVKDGLVYFTPIKGSLAAGEVSEVVDAHNATTHEAGAVKIVAIVNSKVTVYRAAKIKDANKAKKEKLALDIVNADTIPKLRKVVEDLIDLI